MNVFREALIDEVQTLRARAEAAEKERDDMEKRIEKDWIALHDAEQCIARVRGWLDDAPSALDGPVLVRWREQGFSILDSEEE